jgi:hypothetical protein
MDPDTADTVYGTPSKTVEELQRAVNALNSRLTEAEYYGGPDPGHAKAIGQARNRVANALNKARNDKTCPDSLRQQARDAVNDPTNYEPPSIDPSGDPVPGRASGGDVAGFGGEEGVRGEGGGEGEIGGGEFGGVGGLIWWFLPLPGPPLPQDEYCRLHPHDVGMCGA